MTAATRSDHPARIFALSAVVTVAALVVGFLYGSFQAAVVTFILGVMEVSLSFDNAVVNAKVLGRMNEHWQRIFLTAGVLIAVLGMRLILPLIVVGVTAHLNPVEAVQLALQKRPVSDPGSYAAILDSAYPQIAAFGGMFLLLLFLDWSFEERDITWLSWLERPLARMGKLDQLSVVIAGLVLAVTLGVFHAGLSTAIAGILGIVTYLLVNALGTFMEGREEKQQERHADKTAAAVSAGPSSLVTVVAKQGAMLFIYLEILDASFSFDGVIGAFAITPDPIIIALGLGFIGAMFVRSLTVFLVRKGTLSDYVHLEHGAHWAIGVLSLILIAGIGYRTNEVVTGLIGFLLIAAALATSIVRNRRLSKTELPMDDPAPAAADPVALG